MQPAVGGTAECSRSGADGRKADPEIVIESQEMQNVLVLANKAAASEVFGRASEHNLQ